MLKFIQHHLDTIAGIGIYPVLSFVIFFLFFLGVLWWLRGVRREHTDHMAALPITEGPHTTNTASHAH